MTAKEYLSQARHIEQRIKNLSLQLESLRAVSVNITPVYGNMPRSPQRNIYKTENIIVSILDLEEKMKNEIIKLTNIHKTINALCDPIKEAILVNRYIKGLYWENIAYELKISIRRIYQLHSEALRDVSQILSKNVQ